MKIEKIKITDIKPAEYNPRQISSEELTKLTNSINEFGLVDPIIINLKNNKIIGGHQRYEVLINQYLLNNEFNAELNIIKLGDIGWIFTETDLKVKDEDHEKALNLALNKISGEWDFEKLTELLDELDLNGFDISLSGFDGLDDLDIDFDYDDEEEYDVEEDDYEEPDDLEVTVKYGDLYQLGNHRLYCGDATKQESYSILTNKKEMDLVFTDPPYGMKKEKDGVLNDNLNYDDLLKFNEKWIPLSFKALKSNGSWYCWGIDEPLMDIYSNILKPMIKNNELAFRNLITWDKGSGQGQLSPESRMYPVADEKCLFVMVGSESCQGFTVNQDDYSDDMDTVRVYLEKEINKLHNIGLNDKIIANALEYKDGRTVNHWYSKSQFALPTKENYEALRKYGQQVLKQDYDFLKQDYDFLKHEFYKNRSYFNNTHDNMNNVWHFPRISQKERESTGGHATPKPLQLCARAILSSSRENENVLDVFGGSGSTLIACEQLNRNCYMMELDPYYCQVIINRWEEFTGGKATKIRD